MNLREVAVADNIPFEVDDAIVLLLGAPTKYASLVDRVSGITRLEKLIFLLEKETPLGEELTENPRFEPYNFGPFSQKVYQAIEVLSAAQLIVDSGRIAQTEEDSWESDEIIGDLPDNSFTTRDITLTGRGREYYEALIEELPSDTVESASILKDKFGSIPLRQLIRYVYTQYPDFTSKSVIKDRVLGKSG
jgi:uncharacterized protein YwgA